MTTLPDRIRAAALGPTPRGKPFSDFSISAWVGERREWMRVWETLPQGTRSWAMFNEAEKRTHLLFVAEALENQ